MLAGAYDYLIKDEISPDSLERSIRYSIERYNQLKIIENKEKKYKDIFDKSGDIILLTNQSGKIIDANPCAVKKFQQSREELLKMKIIHLIEDNEQLHFWELVITNQLEGEVCSFLTESMDKKILGLISFIVQDEYSYQFIIHDVTKISLREKERREEEKFAAMGRIARIIAHEVKNPLTNINFAINELREENKNPETMMLIEIVERNCMRINNLVTELLTSTRFSKLNLAKNNLNELIVDAIKMAEDSARNKNVNIKSHLTTVGDLYLDGEKIKVALLNIIVNGIEAIEEKDGGEIFITNTNNNGKIVISINDNGKGIPKENLNKLFEAFYTNGKDGGTGLGLTTTQNVILNHYGSIHVESEVGTGTTFTITLLPSELEEMFNSESLILKKEPNTK
ncbi:Sensor protein ZraS [compost metagenome]